MNYFDASYLIPLVKRETLSEKVAAFTETIAAGKFVTSFWTIVECRSALAREVRMERIAVAEFKSFAHHLDSIIAGSFQVVLPVEGDFRLAATMIEPPESGLRAGDAMHLAIARRLGARILTLDRRMAAVASQQGIPAGVGFDQEAE